MAHQPSLKIAASTKSTFYLVFLNAGGLYCPLELLKGPFLVIFVIKDYEGYEESPRNS